MSKRGKLSKVEEFYILNNREAGVESLARELDRTVNAVQKVLDANPTEEEPKKEGVVAIYPKAGPLMGRKTRNGKNVATVMTPGASEAGDTKQPSVPSRYINDTTIHKPLGED